VRRTEVMTAEGAGSACALRRSPRLPQGGSERSFMVDAFSGSMLALIPVAV